MVDEGNEARVRVTVCELPHEPAPLETAWAALCEHSRRHASELVLLPEFAFSEAVWENERYDGARWSAAEALSGAWMGRLRELHAEYVVGTCPVTIGGHRYNQGYIWSATGVAHLRRKFYVPDEPGGWEESWFDRGDASFPVFRAGALSLGLNICTELWAVETFSAYAANGVQAILSPRATGSATVGKWIAAGIVAAVRTGAFSLSSNRVNAEGTCGGVGWVIDPDGQILARTTADAPFATTTIDLRTSSAARESYPRYVFRKEHRSPTAGEARSPSALLK